MGTRLGTLGSKAKGLVDFSRPKKRLPKFPEHVDYEEVFKNHAALMAAYGAVLKIVQGFPKNLFRRRFVESHIYKKLQLLKRIYLIEIATLYGTNNNATRLTLDKYVEDIEKLSGWLFYFSASKILIPAIPAIVAILSFLSQIVDFFPTAWLQSANNWTYIVSLILAGMLGIYFLLYLGLTALSFIDKRLLFIFLENKPKGYFDKWKRRYNAFLGKDVRGTIYEKENKLFNSLRMGKEPEWPIDILLLMVITLGILEILVILSILPVTWIPYLFWLLIMPFVIYLMLLRKAW
jgi:hypothetical protein